ncbi:MAG: hypothetical protein ACFHXK_08230 [bacterium]
MKIHFQCNAQGCIKLAIQCPTCSELQDLPIADVQSGIGFICKCGEEFPLHAQALKPVAHEVDELRHLIRRTITVPV